MITTQEAIEIFVKNEKCSTDDCPVTEGCDICPYNVSKEEYEEAIKMIASTKLETKNPFSSKNEFTEYS